MPIKLDEKMHRIVLKNFVKKLARGVRDD